MELKNKILIAITEFSNSVVINIFIGFLLILLSGFILLGLIIKNKIRLLEKKNEVEKIEKFVKVIRKYRNTISAVLAIATTLFFFFILIKIFF